MDIVKMSISAGFLIFCIIVIRSLAINKLPKRLFVALWGIVYMKLFLPLHIPIRLFPPNLINVSFMNPNPIHTVGGAPTIISNSAVAEHLVVNRQVIPYFQIIWLIGGVVLSCIFLYHYIKSYLKMNEALPIKENRYINEILNTHKIKRTICIVVSDQIVTPITYGVFSAKIVLPKTMDLTKEGQLKYVLEHEIVHIKRFDNLLKLISMTALCVHWFNPLVWVMFVLFNRDLELACDEKVLSILGENNKQAYAYTLINLAEQNAKLFSTSSGFGKNAVEERIVSIMKYSRKTIVSLGIAGLIFVMSLSVFISNAANESRDVASEYTGSDIVIMDSYPLEDTDYAIEASNNTDTEQETLQWIKTFESYGITYEKQQLYYKGAPILYLADNTSNDKDFSGTVMGSNLNAEIAIISKRDTSGKLTGVEEITKKEAKEYEKLWKNEDTANFTESDFEDIQQDWLLDFEKYGITLDRKHSQLYYNDKPIFFFADNRSTNKNFSGNVYSNRGGSGDTGVISKRDSKGNLIGVEELSAKESNKYSDRYW